MQIFITASLGSNFTGSYMKKSVHVNAFLDMVERNRQLEKLL